MGNFVRFLELPVGFMGGRGYMTFKMAFFISPVGSFQRGKQIKKHWYGWQLDASRDSGLIAKSSPKKFQIFS